MSAKIYLSRPGFISGAGSTDEEFIDSFKSGNQKGIKRRECGGKTFYTGQIPDEKLTPTGDRFDTRYLQIEDYALGRISSSVKKAIAQYGEERIGVCVGQCDNGSGISLDAHREFFKKGSFPADYDVNIQGAEYPASYVSKKFGVKGPSLSFATACSSSGTAMLKAKELILSGICDAVIAGGADVVSTMVLLGFDCLGAVSKEITNPFSKNRSGITLGEGAAFFLLSKDDIDDTGMLLLGAGESSDANHLTAPLEDGSGAVQAMEAALADAGIPAEKIAYIHMHGTGTHLNDSMEAKAIAKVFAKNPDIFASTTKPLCGHTLGAAESLGLAACFLASETGFLPVHVYDGQYDGNMPKVNLVAPGTKLETLEYAMANSFAFGGCNVSLILQNTRA